MFNPPIIYIFFNRPELVARTFPAVQALRPSRLTLVADGPRPSHPTDAARCRAAREVVAGLLTWPCTVTYDCASTNLGAGRRIASGLTAAFARYGEAIVLEDDILPHPDFFPFCAEMLAKHRDDDGVHGISGFNPVGRFLPHEARAVNTLTHITWGWASWQRAWRGYRGAAEGWEMPAVRARIRRYLNNDLYFGALSEGLKAVAAGMVDTWDYQWVYTMLWHQRRAVVSATNLVNNLGFGPDSTHTRRVPAFVGGLGTHALPLPTPGERSAATDRLFDRVAWQVMLDSSRAKIAVLRLLSRHSRWLTQRALRLPEAIR